MIVLDLLYKICYAPFHKLDGGRKAALAWSTQILGFSMLAVFNALFFLIGINLSSWMILILGGILALAAYYLFNKIYVLEHRNVGTIKYPVLMGILIFILLMSSLLIMMISLAKY